jgi:Flp pilus assembly protein TadB
VGAIAAALSALSLVVSRCGRPGPQARFRHPDVGAMRDAGWHGIARFEGIRALSVALALALATSAGLPPWSSLVGALAPSVWIRARADAARRRARRALTGSMAGIEGALRSGSSLAEALRREVEACPEPLARRRLEGVLRTFDLGEGLDAALRSSAAAMVDHKSALLLETLAMGIEERLASGRLIELIAEVVDRQRFEEALEDEIRARAYGARQQQWLLALLVPAIALVLIGSMPALAAELDSTLGRFVLIPAAAALEVGGIVLADRIVSGALE